MSKSANCKFQVMLLIASGKTVSTYRARSLEKTGLRTNAELTHCALQNKLV